MMGLIASQVGLLVVLAGLGMVVVSLARQIGVLHERTAPAGELLGRVRRQGRVNLDGLHVTNLAGNVGPLGRRTSGCRLGLLFISEACPVCKSLLPGYEAVLEAAGMAPWVVDNAVSPAALSRLAATYGLDPNRCLASPQLAVALQVLQTPTLAILDGEGRVLQRERIRGPSHLAKLVSQLAAD